MPILTDEAMRAATKSGHMPVYKDNGVDVIRLVVSEDQKSKRRLTGLLLYTLYGRFPVSPFISSDSRVSFTYSLDRARDARNAQKYFEDEGFETRFVGSPVARRAHGQPDQGKSDGYQPDKGTGKHYCGEC